MDIFHYYLVSSFCLVLFLRLHNRNEEREKKNIGNNNRILNRAQSKVSNIVYIQQVVTLKLFNYLIIYIKII